MTTRNLISIICPNYNKENYVADTIKSVISQTSDQWELIIVDDGSTDDSIEIISSFTSAYSNIKLLKRDISPKGGSTCRNIGLSIAKGQYILFLDSDDILAPHCLEQRLRCTERKQINTFGVFPIGNFKERIGDSGKVWETEPEKDHLKSFLSHKLPWHTSSVLWNKTFLLELNGFNEHYARLQDVELHTRALLATSNYYIFDKAEPDVYYRISQNRSRSIYSQHKYISLFAESAKAYIVEFNERISNLNMPKRKRRTLRKALYGTVFALFERPLTYGYRLNFIDKQDALDIVHELKMDDMLMNLIPFHKSLLLTVYIKLFQLNAWKIKGFNASVRSALKGLQ
jgi:glycosyltransferase involved in cell wall biosynthesis